MLVDTNTRDTVTEIFGHKVAAPIGLTFQKKKFELKRFVDIK